MLSNDELKALWDVHVDVLSEAGPDGTTDRQWRKVFLGSLMERCSSYWLRVKVWTNN